MGVKFAEPATRQHQERRRCSVYLLWLNKSFLALTKAELLQLLSSRPDIWEKGFEAWQVAEEVW